MFVRVCVDEKVCVCVCVRERERERERDRVKEKSSLPSQQYPVISSIFFLQTLQNFRLIKVLSTTWATGFCKQNKKILVSFTNRVSEANVVT